MTKGQRLLFTYSAMLVAAVFWGFSFIWSIKLLEYYDTFTIIFFRLLISSSFLFVSGVIIKRLKPLRKKDIGILALLALFEPFFYFLGETNGLKMVSATVSSVVISTIPLFAPIAAWFFFKQKLSILNFIGILISILGVFLVILNEDYRFAASIQGMLLLGLAVFSAVAYSVIVLKLTDRYNVFSIIFYQNLFGTLYFMPLFIVFDYEHFITVEITFEIVKSLVFLAILASSLAFMLFTFGIRELGMVKASSIANIIPVFTAIFSYFFLNEILSWVNILGILVVLSGLFLSQSNKAIFMKTKLIPLNIRRKINGL